MYKNGVGDVTPRLKLDVNGAKIASMVAKTSKVVVISKWIEEVKRPNAAIEAHFSIQEPFEG
jgi:hypothetical protein